MNTVKLGYRQKTILDVLSKTDRAVPFGLLVRACGGDACAYNSVAASLRLLRQRGLVRQERRGWWAA